jgi:serine/threonine protein kinase
MKIDMIESQNNMIAQNIIRDIDNKDNNFIGDKLSDFEILQVLGKSSLGFVAKVKSKKNLKIYAMKKNDLSLIQDENLRKYYENEYIFMKKLEHPNICKLYNTFKERDIIYTIIEYMDNGDLFTFIKANKKFGKRISEDKLWNIFQQCLNGLVYIHSLGIIHRDIKPANFFLNSEGQIKLSDFSVSTIENIEKVNNFTKDIKKKRRIN